jgi:hypothetical protein
MALIKCPECGKDVSDAAAACPHCGHPIRQAAPAIAAAGDAAAAKKPATGAGKGCLTVIGIMVALLIFGGVLKNSSLTACSSDWTKCTDNEDLVNHYSDWYGVRSACERAAEQDARFGTPKWPFYDFGTFHKGNDYVRTGLAVSIEPDAQFQNAFGAMVHSRVTCSYDLRAARVVDISVVRR